MNTKLITCSLFAIFLAPGCGQQADKGADESIADVAHAAQVSSSPVADQGIVFTEFDGDAGSCASVSLSDADGSDVCIENATAYELVDRPDGRCADLVATIEKGDDTSYRPAGTFCEDGGKPALAKTAAERAQQIFPASIRVAIKHGKRFALNATGLKFETSNGMIEILDAPDCFVDLDSLALEFEKAVDEDGDSVNHVVNMKATHLEDNTTLCNGSGGGCKYVATH